MQRTFWLPTMLATALAAVAAPEVPTTRPMSLQDCIQMALQNNLDLAIERYNPQLSLYGLQGSYGGYDPSFNLGAQHDQSSSAESLFQGGMLIPGSDNTASSFDTGLRGLTPWGMTYDLSGGGSDRFGKSFGVDTNGNIVTKPFESSTATTGLTITQPLLKNFWIDSTRLSIQVAKITLKKSELALKQQVMTTVATVEQAYFDLIYAREYVVVQEKAVELATRLLNENRKRVEVGALAPLDEKQAESQAASNEANLIAARNSLSIQENTVKQLMSDNFPQWASITIIPSGTLEAQRRIFNLQDSWGKGLTQRPDLLQAKLDLQKAGIQVKYTRNQLYPQLDAFVTYGWNGSGREYSDAFGDWGSGDRPYYSYGGKITFPLGNISARSNHRTSKAQESQAVLFVKRLEQNIMIEIDNAVKQSLASFEAVQATRKASEYAAEALAAGQKKLENGKSTTFEVLQLQRDLTAARGTEIQALAAYNKTLSKLRYYEGGTLEAAGVDLTLR
jgi:outer membrane protein TolC